MDYGRGDGWSVGPGQDKEWDPPRLMNPLPSWVSGYRGLWGLYTRDPFEGEDAPAGPMYNRDKTISREWFDPVAGQPRQGADPGGRARDHNRASGGDRRTPGFLSSG